MIVEWNTHLFSTDIERYPFHPQATYIPEATRLADDPLADYCEHMASEGIDRAVLVHPEPYGDDHRLLLDCLKQDPNRFRGTSLFYPEDKDAPSKLVDLVRQEPKIVSTRFHAHRGKQTYFDSFDEPGVRALWEAAGELGLVIELHIGPDYGAQAAEAIRTYPQYPVLIDHLAEPHMGNAVEYAEILALARYDNVYMKVSGLNHFSDDEPLCPSTKNFTRLVSNAFGAERLVWGSGTPRIIDVHLSHFTAAQREMVKGDNLIRLLSW